MTLSEFEHRLQQANPRLRIKRYGIGKAGIHYGNSYICRVPQGEITAYTVVKESIGHSGDHVSDKNPTGAYKYDLIERRGRHGVTRILLSKHLIKHSDQAKLAH